MKVYIDGENCRKSLTNILLTTGAIKNQRDLTTYKLRELLSDVLGADETLEISYYSSEIRLPNGYTPTADTMNQVNTIREFSRRWVSCLKLQNIKYVKAGNLKVKSSKPCRTCGVTQEILQEKGVDVRIAADMFEDAYVDNADTLAIFSSDSDLCPVLHKIKAKGRKIIYICIADRVNRAMSAVANETVTIPISKIKQYL
jgi:uncharacterized LabA/DUF88 family protein